MNEAVALAQSALGSFGLNDFLALVGFPSQRRSSRELANSVQEILSGVGSVVDGLLLRAIDAKDRTEFNALRVEIFFQYSAIVTALSRMVKVVVPDLTMDRVLDDSFCELETEFREHGAARFGEVARDQATFTV